MAKPSSSIFKELVSSPIGIISEYIINILSLELGCKPLKDFIAEIQTGKTPPMNNPDYYSSKDIEWIKPSDIGFEKYISASDWISNNSVKEKKATIYKPNTLLIICIGGGIGRLGLVDKICSSNQQITGILLNDRVLPEYAYYFFLSRYKIFEQNSSKTILPIINQKGLGNLDFVCPEIGIQKEIVRLLSYYEDCLKNDLVPSNQEFKLEERILNFANKAFKVYQTQKSLRRENTTQATLLTQLRQAYLQEAVMGKLTASTTDDAHTLLADIKAQKAQLIKEGKLRKEKPLPPIKQEEIPFEIPKNWVWCRLGEIGEVKRGKSPIYSNVGNFIILNQKCVRWFDVEVEHGKVVNQEWYESLSEDSLLDEFDILVNSTGDGTIGRSAIADEKCKGLPFDSHILRIRSIIESKYICYLINSNFGQQLVSLSKGATSTKQTELGVNNLNNFPIPLPPLSEQQAIVAKVEGLLEKVSALEAENKAQQAELERLMSAVLQESFSTTVFQTVQES